MKKCPNCGQNPFLKKHLSLKELRKKIENKEISLYRLKIRHWALFASSLYKQKGSP